MELASRRVLIHPGEAVHGSVEAMPTDKTECAKFPREVPRVCSAHRLLSLRMWESSWRRGGSPLCFLFWWECLLGEVMGAIALPYFALLGTQCEAVRLLHRMGSRLLLL